MRWLLPLFLFLVATELPGQQALTEIKKQAFGNPYNAANENFINMMNEMSAPGKVSLLLFDSWVPMEIIGKDSSWVIVDSANYHIEQDKILFFNQGQFYQIFPEKIDHIVIGERRFISTQYVHKKSVERAYFEVLVDGDFTLLQQHRIERKVTNNNPMGLPAAREIEWIQSGDLYYLTSSARRPEPVPSKKRDLIMKFRRDRGNMAIFAGEQKLSPRKDEDVITLFTHYNDLGKEQLQ